MRSIALVLVAVPWVCGPPVAGLAAEAGGRGHAPMSRVLTGRQEVLARIEEARKDLSAIRTGYAGHYCCKDFPGSGKDLCAAASNEDRKALDRLIEAGVDIDVRSEGPLTKGMTVLMLAVWEKWNIEAARLLLDAGADVNAKGDRGSTALIYAAQSRPGINLALLELLIRAGADVKAQGDKGMTALMHASMHDDPQAVKVLIEAGADVRARDKTGWTALMHANRRKSGHARVVQLLIEMGSEVNATHKHGGTALSVAAYNGHRESVELLLAAGAGANVRDTAGWTPLICAAIGGHHEIVKRLIDAGADLRAKDRMGRTALSCASDAGHEETVRVLATAGAR